VPMTNADIIRIVKKWQAAGFVHELTCRIDSTHDPLVPIEREGAVVLGCPTCGTAQERIPDFVLQSEAALDRRVQELDRSRTAELERRRRSNRIFWWFAGATFGGGLIAGQALGPVWTLGGIVLGAMVALAATRDAFRER